MHIPLKHWILGCNGFQKSCNNSSLEKKKLFSCPRVFCFLNKFYITVEIYWRKKMVLQKTCRFTWQQQQQQQQHQRVSHRLFFLFSFEDKSDKIRFGWRRILHAHYLKKNEWNFGIHIWFFFHFGAGTVRSPIEYAWKFLSLPFLRFILYASSEKKAVFLSFPFVFSFSCSVGAHFQCINSLSALTLNVFAIF